MKRTKSATSGSKKIANEKQKKTRHIKPFFTEYLNKFYETSEIPENLVEFEQILDQQVKIDKEVASFLFLADKFGRKVYLDEETVTEVSLFEDRKL